MTTKILLGLAVVSAGSGQLARAAQVASLNTGFSAGGVLLAAGAVDPHYQLIVAPSPLNVPETMSVIQTTDPDNFPFQYWIPNSTTSEWIVPYVNGIVNVHTVSPGGTFIYRTTFDLAGFDPLTAKIQGNLAVDEAGIDILINGGSTGIQTNDTEAFNGVAFAGSQGFNAYTPFTISGGFVAGLNTIDFVTNNLPQDFGNPVGLRVEANVTANAVPEPGSLVLMGGVGMLLGRRRNRGFRG